jgi:hypothetical protein
MNVNLIPLQQRREQILQEMAAIDRLRRGHLSEQFFKTKRQGKTVRQGPYYVLQRWFQGKNLCERIPADQVEPVRQGVQGYKRFRQLAQEFAALSEELTLLADRLPEAKKKRKPPPTRSSSPKPPAS